MASEHRPIAGVACIAGRFAHWRAGWLLTIPTVVPLSRGINQIDVSVQGTDDRLYTKHLKSTGAIKSIDCPATTKQIAALQTQLENLQARQDAETDPYARRKIGAEITRVNNEIETLTDRARSAGCI